MISRLALLAALGSLVACAGPQPASPASLPRRIAILAVHNRTGDPLTVAGSGLISRYVTHAGEATVSDVLRGESGFQLEQNGFEIVSSQAVEKALQGRVPTSPESAADLAVQSGLGIPCLYLEIRRWEPDVRMHVKYVVVGVTASLVDASTRRVLWQVERRPSPVLTPGEVMLESAYITAAGKVATEMFAPLHPGQ